ncbi:MAG: hypothetical protein ACM3Q1_13615 [Bacteroidales bacterium]
MIRGLPTTIVCACLAGAIGVGLFFIKHEVKEQEARLSELNYEIQSNQEAMHVLKAEWSYLNDPARLRALSEKHLSMKVMGPSQIASLDTLPGGPVYAAARPAAPAVARAEPAAAPVATAMAKPATTKPAAQPVAVARAVPAKPDTNAKLAAAKPAAPAKPAATTAVAAAQPRPVLVPGADTTPRLAAAPVAAPLPAAAPVQRNPATPGRSIVVQSPALASTPALPGEVR